MTSRPFSLYVHVPFCAQKCPYCDFNTYATASIPEARYVTALCGELDRFSVDPRFVGRSIQSVFFGGGTPSLLSPTAIGDILACADRHFPIGVAAEVTLEANPSDCPPERSRGFAAAGVNRVSFGVQSFSNERLTLLGRDHSADDASRAVRAAAEAGIANVSVDIIFGVPGQTLHDLERDLVQAVDLPINHLSTYSLTIEPGTPFFQRQERGLLTMPKDGVVAEMLDFIPAFLTPKGLVRYEISNYAKPGCESVHNSAYWIGDDYLGIGAGAHSYVATRRGDRVETGERWSTLALPESYMAAVEKGSAVSWREHVDSTALQFEFLYVGLRLVQGVSVAEFERRFGVSLVSLYGDTITQLSGDGCLLLEGDTLRLTARGIAVADSVFEQFVR